MPEEKLEQCDWCKGRGWYYCSETHGVDGIEVHADGKKQCSRCDGTGKKAKKAGAE